MNTHPSIIVTGAAILLAALGLVTLADSVNPPSTPARAVAPDDALVGRGEYLVHNVVLCIDCHSPRDERGAHVPARHLTGAEIPFAPVVPMPAWATTAPSIAGLPAGWDAASMVHFLSTGERPNNLPATRPPMPPYRLNRADAEAVTAYLQSLASR